GIRLLDLSAKVVFPKRFNAMLDEEDNKSTALSNTTLQLVAEKLEQLEGDAPVEILCDKHGGRDYYQPLLMMHLAGGLPQTLQEGREISRYRIEGERTLDISFRMKAESLMPVALSSMLAKYLRELAMVSLNKFWAERIEGLKPTAGYPVDAKRFLAEISGEVEKLGIPRDDFWRKK
ncbi:unnamed protein product, partial [marine sediment metagenome]